MAVTVHQQLVLRFLNDGSARQSIVTHVLDSWLGRAAGQSRGEDEALAALIDASRESPARLTLIDEVLSERLDRCQFHQHLSGQRGAAARVGRRAQSLG
jgi:hypothetical protein